MNEYAWSLLAVGVLTAAWAAFHYWVNRGRWLTQRSLPTARTTLHGAVTRLRGPGAPPPSA